jgi:predicted Zn-dependent peptidase
MKIIQHPQLPITIYETRLANGMKVVILPRPGYRSIETNLMVNFGSMNEPYALKFATQLQTLPQGTALF